MIKIRDPITEPMVVVDDGHIASITWDENNQAWLHCQDLVCYFEHDLSKLLGRLNPNAYIMTKIDFENQIRRLFP